MIELINFHQKVGKPVRAECCIKSNGWIINSIRIVERMNATSDDERFFVSFPFWKDADNVKYEYACPDPSNESLKRQVEEFILNIFKSSISSEPIVEKIISLKEINSRLKNSQEV